MNKSFDDSDQTRKEILELYKNLRVTDVLDGMDLIGLQDIVVGVITNAGARDTDEIIKTKRIAVYCRNAYSTRGVRPGRLIAESYNFPINCAGALVFPGDLIVADGDGVIVVPRRDALKVGNLAREINIGDQKSRAGRFKRLGIPLDETVKVE